MTKEDIARYLSAYSNVLAYATIYPDKKVSSLYYELYTKGLLLIELTVDDYNKMKIKYYPSESYDISLERFIPLKPYSDVEKIRIYLKIDYTKTTSDGGAVAVVSFHKARSSDLERDKNRNFPLWPHDIGVKEKK